MKVSVIISLKTRVNQTLKTKLYHVGLFLQKFVKQKANTDEA